MTCLELAEKGGIVAKLLKFQDHDYLDRQWRLSTFYHGSHCWAAFSTAAYAAAALLRAAVPFKKSPLREQTLRLGFTPLPGGRGRVLESSDERQIDHF